MHYSPRAARQRNVGCQLASRKEGRSTEKESAIPNMEQLEKKDTEVHIGRFAVSTLTILRGASRLACPLPRLSVWLQSKMQVNSKPSDSIPSNTINHER